MLNAATYSGDVKDAIAAELRELESEILSKLRVPEVGSAAKDGFEEAGKAHKGCLLKN